MSCQGGAETIQDLDNLSGLCEDLQAMVDTIRDATPDLCFYPMFMVNCFEAKQVLKKKADLVELESQVQQLKECETRHRKLEDEVSACEREASPLTSRAGQMFPRTRARDSAHRHE